jgi:DNA repair and recombination protein RAD54 and RAD54-like protein
MSELVNHFIMRRTNTLNAQHLPPKLVQVRLASTPGDNLHGLALDSKSFAGWAARQVVCCRLTETQKKIYEHLLSSKEIRHIMDGKQTNILSSIGALQKLCNHPSLLQDAPSGSSSRGGGSAHGLDSINRFLPPVPAHVRGRVQPVTPELSGKMLVSLS